MNGQPIISPAKKFTKSIKLYFRMWTHRRPFGKENRSFGPVASTWFFQSVKNSRSTFGWWISGSLRRSMNTTNQQISHKKRKSVIQSATNLSHCSMIVSQSANPVTRVVQPGKLNQNELTSAEMNTCSLTKVAVREEVPTWLSRHLSTSHNSNLTHIFDVWYLKIHTYFSPSHRCYKQFVATKTILRGCVTT